MWLKILGH